MDIELFDKNRHDINEVKVLLSMATGDQTPENLDSFLFEYYSDDNHLLFVSSEANIIIAIIGFDCSGKPSGIIKHLAVLPAHRRCGIGRHLILETAGALGLSTVELETDQDAVGFYHACGFTSTEIESNYPGIRRFRCIGNMLE